MPPNPGTGHCRRKRFELGNSQTWVHLATCHLPSSPQSTFSWSQYFKFGPVVGLQSAQEAALALLCHTWGPHASQAPIPSDTAALPSRTTLRYWALWLTRLILLPFPQRRRVPTLLSVPLHLGIFSRTLPSRSPFLSSFQPFLFILASTPVLAFSILGNRDVCRRERKQTRFEEWGKI